MNKDYMDYEVSHKVIGIALETNTSKLIKYTEYKQIIHIPTLEIGVKFDYNMTIISYLSCVL